MALEASTKLGDYEEIHFLGVGSSATDPELAAKEVWVGLSGDDRQLARV